MDKWRNHSRHGTCINGVTILLGSGCESYLGKDSFSYLCHIGNRRRLHHIGGNNHPKDKPCAFRGEKRRRSSILIYGMFLKH